MSDEERGDRRNRSGLALLLLALVAGGVGATTACGGGDATPVAKPSASEQAAPADDDGDDGDEGEAKGGKAGKGGKAAKAGKMGVRDRNAKGPDEALPTLLIVQAHFNVVDGKPTPLPAKLILLRNQGDEWFREEILDPEANVFHKAIPWGKDGILTIGAERAPKPATLKVWKKVDGEWKSRTLWERAWDGATWDRFRDIEVGDVNNDGKDEIVLATHDRGVIAVGTNNGDDGWTFVEMNEQADTFVHEIEIGDVDGDGKLEFYATPSERNKASGESQPGGVLRYDYKDGAYVGTPVVHFDESHAKEILVADIDGDGTDELYVVREAIAVKEGKKAVRKSPVTIFRFTADGKGGLKQDIAATIDDDQTRFLLAADADWDGQLELIAAGKESGLWMLEPNAEGGFDDVQIDADSGGFEHATHAADLDGDGHVEIYVASDAQKEFRRYTWNPDTKSFDKFVIDKVGPEKNSHITWNIQDGKF